MAVTIEGAKLSQITLERKEDVFALTGVYKLMSSTGIVLASQNFNAYNSMTVAMSPVTTKLLHDFVAGLQADLNQTLGLT